MIDRSYKIDRFYFLFISFSIFFYQGFQGAPGTPGLDGPKGQPVSAFYSLDMSIIYVANQNYRKSIVYSTVLHPPSH